MTPPRHERVHQSGSRSTPRRLAALAVAWAMTALLCGGAAGGNRAATSPTLEQLVGQSLVVAMQGTAPSVALLDRIRRGQIGGVILFGGNVSSPQQVRMLTAQIQRVARKGGMPRLLIAVDQEGGAVRRLPWAPPGLPAAELGRRPIGVVRAAGRATGAALRRAGIDADLAPVADVPVARSFLVGQERAFGSDPERVASRAVAFATGLADVGVAGAVKHFPGIGRAISSTDVRAVSIRATMASLEARDLVPFRRAITTGVPMVMLANASYSAFENAPAVWSPAVVDVLRAGLGFEGVIVTDALEPLAATSGLTLAVTARLAAQAGADALLLTADEGKSAAVFSALVGDVRAGRLSIGGLRASYKRILALKRGLP